MKNYNELWKGGIYMCEVRVVVELKGKFYQTNVIANKEASNDEIYDIARKQVLDQWSK